MSAFWTVVLIVFAVAVAWVAFGFGIQLVFNGFLNPVFHLPTITFWQASACWVGLIILCLTVQAMKRDNNESS